MIRIYYSLVGGEEQFIHISISENIVVISDLTPDSTYSFRVTMIDASGNESILGDDLYNTITVNTPPLPPLFEEEVYVFEITGTNFRVATIGSITYSIIDEVTSSFTIDENTVDADTIEYSIVDTSSAFEINQDSCTLSVSSTTPLSAATEYFVMIRATSVMGGCFLLMSWLLSV